MRNPIRIVARVGLIFVLVGSSAAQRVDAGMPRTVPPTSVPPTTGPSAVEPAITGPSVTLDRLAASPGEHVVLTIDGFTALLVTVSFCGNEDRRGSTDCNMAASQSVDVHADGTPSVAELPVAAPPVGCPCLVRVSSRLNDEVAVTPISVIGHPVGPVIGGPDVNAPLVAVTIAATPVPHGLLGWVKSNLGGSVPYDVTVSVRNISTEALHHVTVFGSAGLHPDDAFATLEFDSPDEILPGQTWTQVVSAEVPAPSLSTIHWQVVASRAGPWVTADLTTRHRPMLLMIVAMLLVIDLAFLLIRKRMRRRAAREWRVLTADNDDRVEGNAPELADAGSTLRIVDAVPV